MTNYSLALDGVFRALACPARRTIVERLIQGAATVSELAEPLAMALPTVLQHLRVLEDCGLVRSAKAGRVRICRIEPAAMTSAEDWMVRQRAVWEARLDRLDDYIMELKKKETGNGDSKED